MEKSLSNNSPRTSLISSDSDLMSSNIKIDLSRPLPKATVLNLCDPSCQNDDEDSCEAEESVANSILPVELSTENWLIGGALGSRNSLLLFRSSALANPSDISIQSKPGHKLHVTYKVLQAETKLLSKLLDCHGVSEVSINSPDFNLLWTGSHPKPGLLRALSSYQRVNHFPRSYELTRKDRLYKNIERMQHWKGYKHFDFIPQTFLIPIEYNELCTMHHKIKGPWIVKPVASSRGRGIFIVETPNQVPLEEPVVVAKYISNPLLVAGHKCDLRLYVAVTSMDPLLIYIYEEGLVRFATVKYDSSHKQLWNPCMHLCNYSINKYHSDYVKSEDPSAENVGHKWTLSALLRHLKSEGKDTALLMSRIEDLVIKAILASAHSIIAACNMFVPHPNNCFELFGFDILVDDNLKPWLLEVNLSPSLGCDSPLDVRLKSAMLSDLLTLVGIPAVDPVLRPSPSSLSSTSSRQTSQLKIKLGNYGRVRSEDLLSHTVPKRSSKRLISSALTISSEENKMLKMSKAQFDRRGGFVRIFPAVDSWPKYAQYLNPQNGIPISGTASSLGGTYLLASSSHNFNLLLYAHLFPQMPVAKRESSVERIGQMTAPQSRQSRYERMLSQGHKSPLMEIKVHKDSYSLELRKQVIDLLKGGKKLTQIETRKTFSQYLCCILKRLSAEPNREEHTEIVSKFLQRASNYLRTPYLITSPSHKLETKDRAAVVAKQLNDFLYLYNRETELIADTTDKSRQVPTKLYTEFLENARESDFEEVLIYQTSQNVPINGVKCGFQGVLKCIPQTKSSTTSKTSWRSVSSKQTSKGIKISSRS